VTPEKYRFLLWQLIAAADSGLLDDLDIDEVRKHANAGTIAEFIRHELGGNCDFSFLSPRDWNVITERFGSIANAVDSSRKFGVDYKGICLLMAYSLECLQQLDPDHLKSGV
jgi:hypothetical protein